MPSKYFSPWKSVITHEWKYYYCDPINIADRFACCFFPNVEVSLIYSQASGEGEWDRKQKEILSEFLAPLNEFNTSAWMIHNQTFF